MKHEPDIVTPHRRRAGPADYAEAKASYGAGNGVNHIVVREWLLTWGDADYRPFEEWLDQQNG